MTEAEPHDEESTTPASDESPTAFPAEPDPALESVFEKGLDSGGMETRSE